MAILHNLPPQAYTRDVLVKAIEWVAKQPDSVRERATSADGLVSLYLQDRRRQKMDWTKEAPVSGETFKADLKNLAEDLKKFESPTAPPPVVSEPTPVAPPAAYANYVDPGAPLPPPKPPAMAKTYHPPLGVQWNLDGRSLTAAREIQSRLNLGSEIEALRLLVTLGLERARQMFD